MPQQRSDRSEPLEPDEALRLVLANSLPLDAVDVEASEAVGTALCEAVVADRDYPPFDRAMMDGFAVRVGDAGSVLPVAGEVKAGARSGTLPPAAVMAVMTGAPCPGGTEAVVPLEEVETLGSLVRLPSVIEPGQHIVRRGLECRSGAVVLAPGQVVTPLVLAVLSTVGRAVVRVRPSPSAAIISTGDELVVGPKPPGPDGVRSSNGPMLAAMARAAGASPIDQLQARDTLADLLAVLQRASKHDVVVLSGGVSAGRYDLVPQALSEWGATILFHGVAQRPGKPLLFATRGRQLVFGLPGTPLAAHLGFHRYVWAAVRSLLGLDVRPYTGSGVLTTARTVRGRRTVFQPCRVTRGDDRWQVHPLTTSSTADLFAASGANAMVRFEPSSRPYAAGTPVEFEWLREAGPTVAPVAHPTDPHAPEPGRILSCIADRRSRYAFDPTPVHETVLARAFEAARWAPSTGNGQPWRFVVTDRGSDAFERLSSTLRPRNEWAKAAPHLVLLAAAKTLVHPTKPPRPNRLALLEAGLALGNLLAQATADGLVAHPLDGFDEEAAASVVGVPSDFQVAVLLAVGRPGDPAMLDDQLRVKQERPRERVPASQFVFHGSWQGVVEAASDQPKEPQRSV